MKSVMSNIQSRGEQLFARFIVPMILFLAMQAQYFKVAWVKNGMLGGYVHDTNMAQYIPPVSCHFVTGTWTQVAGQVAGTIAMHKAAAAETNVITIPIAIPSNAVANKGAYLKSVEIDYEILVADLTSSTPVINLVTRGTDTNVAVVAAQTFTQSPALASAKTVEQHKLVLTITTPFWVSNTQYVLVQLTNVAPATTTFDLLAIVANFTERM